MGIIRCDIIHIFSKYGGIQNECDMIYFEYECDIIQGTYMISTYAIST